MQAAVMLLAKIKVVIFNECSGNLIDVCVRVVHGVDFNKVVNDLSY